MILFGCASDNRSQRRKKTPKQRKTWKTTSERACHGSEMHSCVLFVPKSPSRRGQARSAARCGGAPGATPRDHRGDRREHGQTQPKPRPNNGRKTDNGNAAAATTSRCAQNVVFSDLTSGQEQTSNRRCASGRLSDMGKIFFVPSVSMCQGVRHSQARVLCAQTTSKHVLPLVVQQRGAEERQCAWDRSRTPSKPIRLKKHAPCQTQLIALLQLFECEPCSDKQRELLRHQELKLFLGTAIQANLHSWSPHSSLLPAVL